MVLLAVAASQPWSWWYGSAAWSRTQTTSAQTSLSLPTRGHQRPTPQSSPKQPKAQDPLPPTLLSNESHSQLKSCGRHENPTPWRPRLGARIKNPEEETQTPETPSPETLSLNPNLARVCESKPQNLLPRLEPPRAPLRWRLSRLCLVLSVEVHFRGRQLLYLEAPVTPKGEKTLNTTFSA